MNSDSLEQWVMHYFDDGQIDSFASNRSAGSECGNETDCKCDEVQHNFFALVDRQLSLQQASRLLRHVLSCAECGERLRNEHRVRMLMRKSVASHAPASLRVRITQTFTRFESQ